MRFSNSPGAEPALKRPSGLIVPAAESLTRHDQMTDGIAVRFLSNAMALNVMDLPA